jgi:hypothetical protein
MKTKTPRRNQVQPAVRTSVSIPPFAAAIARFADPHPEGIDADFERAYARIPALIDALIKGDDDERWGIITAIAGLDRAEHDAEQGRIDRRDNPMAHAIHVLRQADVDLVADLTTPVMNAGFFVGLAYACYILQNGGAR